MAKVTQKISTIVLWLMFAAAIVLLVATFTNINSLLIKPLVRNDQPLPSDVVIILGGGILRDTHSLPWGVEERVAKGVELFKAGYATKIIVAGGIAHYQGEAESEVMAPYAEMLGVPAEDIIQENKSKNTHTNALNSTKIMQDHGWQRAIVVTSDFHTGRACRIFKKVTQNILCVAAPRHPSFDGNYFRNLMDFRATVREYGAWVYNWLRGNV
ncbi:MAG: YdcF family protein [Patescibacteria group bacterium]